MRALLLITGPPGAGKSTVAERVAAALDPSVLVSGDSFFGFLRSGQVAPWLPESHDQNTVVTAAAASATAAYVAGDYEVVYDGIVGPWFLPTFRQALGSVDVDYVVLLPEPATTLDRVATRTTNDFRDPDATKKMHDEFLAAVPDTRHVIDSTDLTVDEVADRVLTGRSAGTFRLAPHEPMPEDRPA